MKLIGALIIKVQSFGVSGLRARNHFQDFSAEWNMVIAFFVYLVFKEFVIKLWFLKSISKRRYNQHYRKLREWVLPAKHQLLMLM